MIQFEGKTFQDKKQALNALAFCHYPVTVVVNGNTQTFDSFDKVKDWVENYAVGNENTLAK